MEIKNLMQIIKDDLKDLKSYICMAMESKAAGNNEMVRNYYNRILSRNMSMVDNKELLVSMIYTMSPNFSVMEKNLWDAWYGLVLQNAEDIKAKVQEIESFLNA